MRQRLPLVVLLTSTVSFLAFILVVEFWPGTGPTAENSVTEYLAQVQQGNELAALKLWRLSDPGHTQATGVMALAPVAAPVEADSMAAATPDAAIDFTIELADTLHDYRVSPATYWTSCCEPQQMEDGTDAFTARVNVQLSQHAANCGLPLDQIPHEDLTSSTITFYLLDDAHDSVAYNWGLPWERWFARPRGRQQWRIIRAEQVVNLKSDAGVE
ncbi:MAG: hypothetical protein U9R25_18995 [Chloroflexota bacterium]|nr:hypothetical protein [Chloroflexota bacterium]